MKALIVGAGALGSVFGGLLRAAGHEVDLLEIGPRLEDIRELGLRVSGLFGEYHAQGLGLHSRPDTVSPRTFDLILITVKSFDTASAAASIARTVGDETLVLSLQNGLGNYEAIRDTVGETRTLAGRVIFGAEFAEKAHVRVTVYAEPVMIGNPTNAVSMARLEEIARAFSEAGIPSEATAEIDKYLWAKMLYNCALNPLSALLQVPYGKLLESEATRNIMRQVIEEVFAVARARRVELFWKSPEDYVEVFHARLITDTAAHYASMAQDLKSGRRTEIEALNGAIVRFGEEADVGCPVNAALSDLIRAAECLTAFRNSAQGAG